jgi:hypothetical protein
LLKAGQAFGELVLVVGTFGTAAPEVTGVNAAETTIEAAPSLINLNRQLAAQKAGSAFTETGELSPGAIRGADEIISADRLGNPAIRDGFAKFTTRTFQSPSGPFQVHFYQNPTTGEIFYGLDYKAVFNAGRIGQ